MKIHELKTWPPYYSAVVNGHKGFEYRKNDRDFSVGDHLNLREWNPDTQEYTGRDYRVVVNRIWMGMPDFPEGYCIREVA
jgi:hypothetical protein